MGGGEGSGVGDPINVTMSDRQSRQAGTPWVTVPARIPSVTGGSRIEAGGGWGCQAAGKGDGWLWDRSWPGQLGAGLVSWGRCPSAGRSGRVGFLCRGH